MGKECVKCGYVRLPSDTAPDYECPKCGVIYAKAEAAIAAKKLAEKMPIDEIKTYGLGIGNGSLTEYPSGQVEYRAMFELTPSFTVWLKDVAGVSGQRKSNHSASWTMKIHGMGCILAERDVAIGTTEKVAAWFQQRIDLRKTDQSPIRETPAQAFIPNSSRLDQLQQLANLHRTGVLTDDEFSAMKREILASKPASGQPAIAATEVSALPPPVDLNKVAAISPLETPPPVAPRALKSEQGVRRSVEPQGPTKTCKKCKHVAAVVDSPDAACPACGAIYARVEQAIAARLKAAPSHPGPIPDPSRNQMPAVVAGKVTSYEARSTWKGWALAATVVLVISGGWFTYGKSKEIQLAQQAQALTQAQAQAKPLIAQGRTISDFESSSFYKKETLVRKAPAYDLRTGGKNNPYSFKDSENNDSSFGVDVTTKGQQIVDMGISWYGQSTLQPARMSPKKFEQLKELAAFWGVAGQAEAIVEYAESQQEKIYLEGSSQAPRKSFGPIAVYVGGNGGALWVGWTALAAPPTAATQTASANANEPASVAVGTPADTVRALRGKAVAIRQVGSDGNGLLLEWEYPDATFLMGRRGQDGVEAYRVIKIKTRP